MTQLAHAIDLTSNQIVLIDGYRLKPKKVQSIWSLGGFFALELLHESIYPTSGGKPLLITFTAVIRTYNNITNVQAECIHGLFRGRLRLYVFVSLYSPSCCFMELSFGMHTLGKLEIVEVVAKGLDNVEFKISLL